MYFPLKKSGSETTFAGECWAGEQGLIGSVTFGLSKGPALDEPQEAFIIADDGDMPAEDGVMSIAFMTLEMS